MKTNAQKTHSTENGMLLETYSKDNIHIGRAKLGCAAISVTASEARAIRRMLEAQGY